MRFRFTLAFLLLSAIPAHAVIVRGRVTSQLGVPLPGSRVQLISLSSGPRTAADTIAGADGEYELRTDLAGRFLLLTSPSIATSDYAPQLGNPFYGGRSDVLSFDIALDASNITPQQSAQSTLVNTPLGQLAELPTQVIADQLLTQATLLPQLRPTPGVFAVQLGQTGAPAELLLRGAPVEKTMIDGISAELLGGRFNLAGVTSSGLAAVASTSAAELTPAANPLFGVDAQAGVLSLQAPVAATMHPVLTYAGDAGTLSTTRHEAILTAAHSRGDALLSFARFNTDNDLPAQRLHLVTTAANLGYRISGNTSLRITLRDDVDAAPLASPFAFYGIAPATKFAAQNLVAGLAFDTRTPGNWHNLLRYGMVRERSQAYNFATPATGLPVTITGANGYTASGIASFLQLPAREDAITDRDEAMWQTDVPIKHLFRVLLTARYQDERAADLTPGTAYRLERTHFSVAGAVQGEIRHRLFYEASGFLDHATFYGLHGGPRLGLDYVPVRPGTRKFRGTSLRLTAATGLREPSVLEQSLLPTATTPRSRTLDLALDQTLLPRRLLFRAGYFHNQLSHQFETLAFAPLALSSSLAYRTQGLDAELRFQPASRLHFDAGYIYLASLVEQSAANPVANPNFPGIRIGATTALAGNRPFQRPPNTGFALVQYTGTAFTVSLKASAAGRSDDSTNLALNPTLLLPNRNLSPGYTSLDASFTYNVSHAIIFYTQLTNLLDDRHLAPIGYLSTPFLIRLGARVRFGHE